VTYLDYIVLFNRRDQEQSFTAGATRLYLKLLDLANGLGWPDQFAKSDPFVAAVCACSVNPMKAQRHELQQRGLIHVESGGIGRGVATIYRLVSGKKVSDFDTLLVGKVSKSDTLTPKKVSDFDTLRSQNGKKVPVKVSDSDTPYIDKEKRESSAAVAASPTSSFSEKKAGKEKAATPAARLKKPTANADEVAALALPHEGEEFVGLWTMFRTGPKQARKPLSAFALMLSKLGKYPEAFAVVMLEAAIQGDWSGVENDGTARKFAEWQTQQATKPTPARAVSPASRPGFNPESLFYPSVVERPALNADFLAEQQALADAETAARIARFQQNSAATAIDTPSDQAP